MIPIEFILFGAALLLVALSPRFATPVALTAAVAVTVYKTVFGRLREGLGLHGLVAHFHHEQIGLINLLALLLGFALLAKHFEHSKAPLAIRRYLAEHWTGGVILLLCIFVLASFLDNIAAAIIGGTVARTVFRDKVHVGYLVAIVAASNAGGSGSVIGDTTTTMMWIAGVQPREVLSAYVGAVLALLLVAIPAAWQQHKLSPIRRNHAEMHAEAHAIDWPSIGVVAFILNLAIVTNVILNLRFGDWSEVFPFLGISVWGAILLMTPVRKPAWSELPDALRNSVFLLALVWCASMMPVDALPAASAQSTFVLGLISAGFDNIPLTALALHQGGFDWGYLAYAVGFGGSLLWFGSSAGVALAGMFPEAKSVRAWLRDGWYVWLAYVLGYAAMLLLLGWQPGTLIRG
jgi:Na+/H+ antiporter NhaD/arsenite permease-like protein